jgi:hypothetical protein
MLAVAVMPMACRKTATKPESSSGKETGKVSPANVRTSTPLDADKDAADAVSDDAAEDETLVVSARGPLHEAFAQPVSINPDPASLVTKQPPEPIEEVPPDQKPEGLDVQWIPGYWGWEEDRSDYIWVSGCWRVPPEGQRWMPGHWQEVEGGWVWVSGFWAPMQQDQVVFLPPPPPAEDDGPAEPPPDPDSIYVPGNWFHVGTGYGWRDGYWVQFRRDRVWVPARYIWTPVGFLFFEGYWDRPLHDCGWPFAPLRINRERWAKERRRVCPEHLINIDFLIGALFIGPCAQHYYFGDYFEPNYGRLGFVAWPDVLRRAGSYDPNYCWSLRLHADDPQWQKNLAELYRARRSGEVPHPPRTWRQQLQAVKKVTDNKTHKTAVRENLPLTHLQNAAVLTPLQHAQGTVVTTHGSLRTKPARPGTEREIQVATVPKEEHDSHQKRAEQVREIGRQHGDEEAQQWIRGTIPMKQNDPVNPPAKLPASPPLVKPHTEPPKPVPQDQPRPPAQVQRPNPPPPPPPQVPQVHEKPIPQYEPPKPTGPPKKR